jgi:Kef-type K+ transport system membrane component KefB
VVILVGPIVVSRFGLPGLVGLLLGGFAIGPHGLDLIGAGNQTVPELGKLGLLYLMFVAGLELDLHLLNAYRRAAVALGLLAFAVPFAFAVAIGFALGWSPAATFLLGAVISSHTLLVYPALRDAGLAGNGAVATAVGATVLTDTLALSVLAVVAGTQTGSGSAASVLVEIGIGLVVLLVVGLVVLPRVVDLVLRRFGHDRVARYVALIVALLVMATLAEVFSIEGIVGAFFAGIGLNRLVPNEGPSMEQVEFFGTAVFIPVFVVSIGLLLDPSVMFQAGTLGLAALLCAAALAGKAIAAFPGGKLLGFSWLEGAAIYSLNIPQAAATLAATLVGYEIGLFGTTLVNAVLVLIVVTIVVGATVGQQVVKRLPAQRVEHRPLGESVLVVASTAGPSDASLRAASRLARPDGGHGRVLILWPESVPRLERGARRALEHRVARHGFDGHVTPVVDTLYSALLKAVAADDPSLVVVDDPEFDASLPGVPIVVIDGENGSEAWSVIGTDEDAAVIAQRLSVGVRRRFGGRRPRPDRVA